MSETIDQLPATAAVNPTDLFVLWRNGRTFSAPASAIPTQVIGSVGFFNVVTYGADPTGATDSTAKIQAAIAAAQAAGGGIVYFPQGTYLVSASLVIPVNGISLMGAGCGASKIQSASLVIAPTVIDVAAGVSFVKISDLGFFGNSVNPAPPPNAPSVIAVNGGTHVEVENCYFTGNTGTCVAFVGATDGSVSECRFLGTGYNGSGTSNALQNAAVFADTASVGIRVHHNHFEGCKYFGVQIMGTSCEVSFNYLHACYMAGIRVGQVSSSGNGNNCRVIGNEVDTLHENPVDSGGGSGIYFEGVVNCQVQGNIVHKSDSDGFVFAACQQCSVVGNTAYNCCQTGNDCGFQFNPQADSAPNAGMVFVGNVAYDNQGTPTMLNGMRVLGPGSGGAVFSVIVGNSFNGFNGTVGGSPQRGINMTDSILDSDTNIIAWNSDWLDRMHLGAASTNVAASITATGVGTPTNSVLASMNLEKGVMGLNRAVRLKASGVITVATSVTFLLSFGSTLGNILTFAEATAHAGVNWQLEVWLNSADNNNGQHFSYVLYYNGAVVAAGGGNLSVDTTVDETLTLQATTGSGDSITCAAFTLTRE